MKKILLTIILSIGVNLCYSQVYIEKKTRHRFAQLTLGLDIETHFGGHSQFLNSSATISSFDLMSSYAPRMIIGGTHFWGHADFYLAIPLRSNRYEINNQTVHFFRGVETVFKYYPWRIEQQTFRPFVGFSIAPFYFEQSNELIEYGNGPELNITNYPLHGGVTFNFKKYLLELGIAWNYANTKQYFISRSLSENIHIAPLHMNLAFKYILDTTIGAETDWESGRIDEITQHLANKRKLNGFYLGIGLSSAFWLSSNSYNEHERKFIAPYNPSIMLDLGLGYYLYQPDLNIGLGYREYGTSTNTYGAVQSLQKRSIILESTKFIFDYHGFTPFIGPAVSFENVSFKESFEGKATHNLAENKISYGLTFGWDIRPTRIQSWILRTNLRWFPSSKLEVATDKSINFNNLEFNFIQIVIYPNRLF